jgi:hypothetical protein
MSATSNAGRAFPAAGAADDGAGMTYAGDTGGRRTGVLKVDGKGVASQKIPQRWPL